MQVTLSKKLEKGGFLGFRREQNVWLFGIGVKVLVFWRSMDFCVIWVFHGIEEACNWGI